MQMAEAFTSSLAAVFFGNFVTLALVYAFWRIKRDENDTRAIFIALFCMLIIGITGYALRYPS